MKAASESLLSPEFIARLERLELNIRRLQAGDRRGDNPVNRRGPGTVFRGHRTYAAGDDPRFIDWNAFLRLDELVVKEFDAEEVPRVTAFLDVSASMGTSGGRKFEQARRLVAALGFVTLARHGAVRVVPVPRPHPTETWVGRSHLHGFLQEIAQMEPAGGTSFLRTFQSASPPGRRPGLALIASDFLDVGEYRQGLRFLRKRGHQVEALHVFDPLEVAPQLRGVVELVDVETGRRLREDIKPELLERYHEVVEAHFTEIASACRSLGVGYHRLDATIPLEQLVLSVLRGRAVVS